MSEVFLSAIDIVKVRHLQNLYIPLSDERSKNLIITGQNGSGKTSLLDAIAQTLNAISTDNIDLEYIKILGFNNKGKKYLNSIKETIEIPTTINKDSIQYIYELKASIIYDLINNTNTYSFEQRNKPIIID